MARIGAALFVVGVAATYVALGASHQWDFETYYYAATALRAGLNPYDLGSLSSVAGRSIELPYIYPPITLALFLPLSNLPLGLASLVWLSIKCLLAGFLLWIWWRGFLRSVAPDLLLIVALLGFDLALLWDLRTGNIALLEQALLWLGFLAYVRGRPLIAAVLIALASVFKIYPILFLALLLTPGARRNRTIAIGVGLGVLLSLLAIPLVPLESWARALPAAIGQDRPLPNVDPSALTVLRWVSSLGEMPWSAAGWFAPALYIVFVIVLLSVSIRLIRRALRSPLPFDRVATALVLWFVLAPRVMVYSYASAVVPALFVLNRALPTRGWRLGASLLLIFPGAVRLLPGHPPVWLGVVSFLMMFAIWVLWVRAGKAGSAEETPR